MITPFFVIILLLPKELISVFFGEKWLPAAPILQVMAISGFLCSIYNIHTPIIVGLGKPLWQLRRNVTIFVINIAAFFLALPYGIVAVVMAFVISNYIAMIITLLIIHELTSFDPVRYLRTYIIPIVANALMAVILIFPIVLYRDVLNAPFSLAIYPAIGLMMYYTTIILLKPQFFHQVLTLARIALFTKMDEKYERSK
jgi:PST family polysaccharide transporter